MKKEMQHMTGGKLRAAACLILAVVLAAGIAFNGVAANNSSVQYDVKIVSSYTHTAIKAGSDVYFMGTNGKAQFPECGESYSPSPLHLVSDAADVAVSDNRTVTVSEDGTLTVYGIEPTDIFSIIKRGEVFATDAVSADASNTFAAYISDKGEVYTWGDNDCGQLGIGREGDFAEKPVKVELPAPAKKISLGDTFALVLLEDGTVYGWGSNVSLETGYVNEDGSAPKYIYSPVLVTDNAADIDTGSYHSCILKKDGKLYTCGDNSYSQTGVEAVVSSGLTEVLSGVRSVSAGATHNFAVSRDGTVYRWGYGISGQLGTGGDQRVYTPTATNFNYVQVFACCDNTFGIAPDGSIDSFGDNTNYRLGKTDGSDALIPVLIMDKEMNWVYTQDDPDICDPDEGNETPSVPSVGAAPEEPAGPEVVSTPFVSGDGNGAFRPEARIKRSEFLRMLISAVASDYDKTADYGACSFSDVPATGEWYEKYFAFAEQKGILSGYSDGTGRPNGYITRAEAAQLLSTVIGLPREEAVDMGFTDIEDHWAKNKINALAYRGVINGQTADKFDPEGFLKRSEAVTMIARAAGFKPTDEEKAQWKEDFTESPFTDVSTDDWCYLYVLRAVGYVKAESEG